MVPGNHDCDFEEEHDLRKSFLDNIGSSSQQIRDTSIVEELTSIQRSYFDFMQNVSPATQAKYPFSQIAWAFELSFNNSVITCHGYNTAWMSLKKERQGQLAFPLDAIPAADKDCALVISLFHHPYNWQEASVARLFGIALKTPPTWY
jgi:hypothetical protein